MSPPPFGGRVDVVDLPSSNLTRSCFLPSLNVIFQNIGNNPRPRSASKRCKLIISLFLAGVQSDLLFETIPLLGPSHRCRCCIMMMFTLVSLFQIVVRFMGEERKLSQQEADAGVIGEIMRAGIIKANGNLERIISDELVNVFLLFGMS